MRWLRDRIVITMTLAFVALALAQNPSTLAVGVALVAVSVLLAARYAGELPNGREITVGGRARAHRESMTGMASPRHPSTPGRPMSRAPGMALSAA